MPIRLRLTLWYTALLALTLILFGGALYAVARYSLYSEIDRTLQVRARAVEEAMQFFFEAGRLAIESGEGGNVSFQPPPIDAIGTDVYVEQRQMPSLGLVGHSDNLGTSELPLSLEAYERARAGEATFASADFNGEPVKLYTLPVSDRLGEVRYIVHVGRSVAEVQADLQRLALLILGGVSGTLLLALAIGAWLPERALQPVDAVTQAALHISRAEDLSSRLPPYAAADEIGRLIAAFNEMLARLDAVFRDQQRFVADVSHELRTPLTALQGNIDLLKRGAIHDPVARGEALATIESEVARLNRLVADLLLLARADGGEKVVCQPVELDTLLLDIFRQGRLLAGSSAGTVRLRLGHEDQATILGDPDRLKQLFLNLLDNAIKYTPEGEVVLSLWKDEARREVRVAVQDTGIGIAADAIPQLFRRFYRTDKARSRQVGGTGLGLAIAYWIAQAHGGTIRVESEEGRGSTFTVTFPLPTLEDLSQKKVITGSYRTVAPIAS